MIKMMNIAGQLGLFLPLVGAALPAASGMAPVAEAGWISVAQADFASERLAARGELVAALEELAAWCTKKKIFIVRKEVYETILHFAPDHEEARRGQGFIKDKDGNWKATERHVPLKDWDRKAAEQFPARRSEVIAGFGTRLLALLDAYPDEVTPELREELLEEILVADPDDPRVHALRGEAKLEDRWVLEETVLGIAGRAALKDQVRQAFRSVPLVAAAEAKAKELAFGLEWTAVLASPEVRSLGTGTIEEIRRLADAMHATRELFNSAFSVEAHWPAEFTVYTLANPGDSEVFLNAHPAIDEKYRKFLLQLTGSGIQGTGDYAHWAPEEQRRLDGHVRQAIAWLFIESYGVSPEHGWAFEGFGLYLCRELVGTRLTWFVKPSEHTVAGEDNALKARLLDTRTNWMNEANLILQGEHSPKLEFVLGKTVNNLTTADMLYSYVLAAFLLEARPERIPPLLRALGGGESSQEALQKALGLEMPAVDSLVRRWLTERR